MRKLRTTLRRVPSALWAVALLLALAATPVALGAGEGDPVRGGVRNPSPDQTEELRRETQIIARNDSYGTRQSNKGDGGGAIYGCRSGPGGTLADNEPCIRANNLRQGFAFEFETDGAMAGLITVGDGGPNTQPFATNATGVASGLNADYVDGQDFDAAAVAANGGVEARTEGRITAARTGTGTYQVDFPTPPRDGLESAPAAPDTTTCFFQASARSGPAFVAVQGQPEPRGRAVVTTHAANGAPADVPFYITAQCASQGASTTG